MKVKYHQTASRSPVREFVNSLPFDIQKQFYDAVTRLSDGEMLQMPLSRSLASIHRGLHELRLKDASGIYRVFYFIKVKDAIYLLHGFKKKTQHIPLKELELVVKRIKEL